MTGHLEYYQVFYYTAKLGSLTKAAQQLGITQPAVSQSLKQLEQSLGVKLLERGARGVSLTTEGSLLFQYVEKGYEQILLGESRLFRMLNLELGELRIGASDMTLRFYLLPLLERFHESYPGIKVFVSNAPTPETLRSLQEGKIDFGVVSSPLVIKKGMTQTPVREIEDIFVAGRKFIQYKNKTLDLQELERLPMVCLEKNTSTRKYMDEFLKEKQVVFEPEFELATSDMIVQFTLQNLGIGSVVRDFAKPHLEEGRLFELRFNNLIPKREICVVTSTINQMSTAAKNMLQLMGIPSVAGVHNGKGK